jgi:predicted MFS family arabinose efflux permease
VTVPLSPPPVVPPAGPPGPPLIPPPPPPSAPAPPRNDRAAAIVIAVAVTLAFADVSIVALAIPDLYIEFGASIPAVSWVLTGYALSVAIAGFAGVLLLRRASGRRVTAVGAGVFGVASAVAGFAPNLGVLLAARVVQGIGGAALVAGAFAVLAPLVGNKERAAHWWAIAGTIGTAIGPAVGGLVTQLIDWRAVFVVQAPVAVAAVVASLRVPAGSDTVEMTHERRPAGAATADTALALTYGALVGALFLGVLLLVVVWGLTPIEGATAVSTLPLGTLLAARFTRAIGRTGSVIGGAAGLGGGLLTLALIPSVEVAWVALALALCGIGYGLLVGATGPISVPPGGGLRAATLSSAARHLGLVLGLAVIAPVLSTDLMEAADQAPIPATASMLDAPIDGLTKIRIALDIRDALDKASEGEVPDLASVFEANGAGTDEDVAQLKDDIETGVQSVLTRAFRPSFAIGALFALGAGVVGLAAIALARRAHADAVEYRPDAWPVWATVAAVIGVTLAAVALPMRASAAGAAEFGQFTPADPCTAGPDPFPGGGFDATLQRLVLSGLNGAACELGTSREELVLSLEPRSGVDIEWDRDTIEDALRSGVIRAIEDADERDTIPGWIAWSMQQVVEHAPISWFLDQLGVG